MEPVILRFAQNDSVWNYVLQKPYTSKLLAPYAAPC